MTRNVLICVVKSPKDLNMILRSRLYRIPQSHAPKRKLRYVAFYQPVSTQENLGLIKMRPQGFDGLIRYWASVRKIETVKRRDIVRDEPEHPRANEPYYLLHLGPCRTLPQPILNQRRMRVTFGFTTLGKLKNCREVKELFDLPPIEEMVEEYVKATGFPYRREYTIRLTPKKRWRLDFALFLKTSRLGIECDGFRSHRRADQKQKDKIKDADLSVLGWRILRLSEGEIMNDQKACREKIAAALKS
ncbi:MAG: DUF559 domain-containing protein [Elusimicrobia bacterium]|nr:DUF559 domain-containing protein [Elusimicrobiota bacterium]